MPEANAEDRDAPNGLAGQFHRSVQHGRVAWPVGQDDAVCAGGLDIPPGRGVWHHNDATAAFAKGTQDVALHAVIDHRDRQPRAVGVLPAPQLGRQCLEPLLGRGPRRLSHEVLLRQRRHPPRRLGQLGQARPAWGRGLVGQNGPERSMRAQVARQRPRVDLGDRRHLPPLEVVVERRLAGVMAGDRARPADDEGSGPRPRRLRVGIAHPVIALQRVGHADHLPRVGRVREHLLVAGHRGVEHDLSLTDDVRAQSASDERAPVLEDERGVALVHLMITTWSRSSNSLRHT